MWNLSQNPMKAAEPAKDKSDRKTRKTLQGGVVNNEEPRSKLLGIFVGEEIYYTGMVHTQMQRSSKTVLVAAIFPE
jgi:hypothetical protein